MLRIIAGLYRRQLIESLEGDATRPTADRVRENIFNIIQNEIEGVAVLDLFSGTGALGIEALSRGAKHCTFVESNPNAARLVEQNLKKLKVPENEFTIHCCDATSLIANPSRFRIGPETIGAVIADPPYDSEWYNSGIAQLSTSGMLCKNCILCVEMNRYTEIDESPVTSGRFIKRMQREYGKTRIQIWDLVD
jgi:16S rRNA (guanine966-N2)-methyltransferase